MTADDRTAMTCWTVTKTFRAGGRSLAAGLLRADSGTVNVPGIVGLLTLVVTMLVTALSVAREREQGTFDQLLMTPYRPWEILIGKAAPGFIIGVAEATLIIIVAVFWFRFLDPDCQHAAGRPGDYIRRSAALLSRRAPRPVPGRRLVRVAARPVLANSIHRGGNSHLRGLALPSTDVLTVLDRNGGQVQFIVH